METPKKKLEDIYSCELDFPVYAIAWSNQSNLPNKKIAIGSYLENSENQVKILELGLDNLPSSSFLELTNFTTLYPATKIQWQPTHSSNSCELLATSTDVLKLWECQPDLEANSSSKIIGECDDSKSESKSYSVGIKSELINNRGDLNAPLTSFDWCSADSSQIVTSSIDTTITVWDITTGKTKTQLIAHDREVYDVQFVPQSKDVFGSVGADGSLRLFDLRALEHSTIIYESPDSTTGAGGMPVPLLRLSFNKIDPNYLTTFHLDSSDIQLLDIRMAGMPVSVLKNHNSNISAISWSPFSRINLVSSADDGEILFWDFNSLFDPLKHQCVGDFTPTFRYDCKKRVHSCVWGTSNSFVSFSCASSLNVIPI